MPSPSLVQVLVAGFKPDFIIQSIREYPPNRVYLLVPGKKDASEEAVSARATAEKVRAAAGEVISVELVEVPVYDFTQCFRRILEVVRREMAAGSTVLFNVSSGVRVPVLAGYMVATIERCKVVQVIPEHYRLKDGLYSAEGKARFIELPRLPVELPGDEERAVLFTLRELGCRAASMGQLVEHLARRSEFTGGGRPDARAVRSKANYYVAKLAEHEYVSTEKVGRESAVSLTPEGVLVTDALMELERG